MISPHYTLNVNVSLRYVQFPNRIKKENTLVVFTIRPVQAQNGRFGDNVMKKAG